LAINCIPSGTPADRIGERRSELSVAMQWPQHLPMREEIAQLSHYGIRLARAVA